MKIVISAGGTGGHIYPALAIINKIKELEPNSEFLYIGTHNRMEKDIIPKQNIPFEAIEIYGFNRKNIFKNIRTVKCFINSYKRCKKLIKDFNPDIVIGVGGYVTAPVIYAAKKLNFKTFIHEQNSIPGKANLFLAKYSDKIGVSFESSINSFPASKTLFTGNPCSEEAINSLPIDKEKFGLHKNKKLVLFVTGSLGATSVNNFLVKTMNLFDKKEYEILFVTGKNSYDELSNNKFPTNVKVVPYIDAMAGLMKNVDVIVTRAGASTLSEIIALNIPSILIPSPYVPNNHQYKNALDLISKDAAYLVEEKDLKGDILVKKIDEIIFNSKEINKIKTNLKKLVVTNSATKIYDIIKDMIVRK